MVRSYLRLLALTVLGSALAPLIILVASRYMQDRVFPWRALPAYFLGALGVIALGLLFRWSLRRLETGIDLAALDQSVFLGSTLPERWIGLAIFASAALSLFLELALIRWQATVFPFFSFYKNLSLLSCFAGLGIGYSMGKRDRIPLLLTLPLLCWQFLFMMGMRYGMTYTQFQSLYVLPFREQLNMGLPKAARFYYGLQTYYVLAIVFLLTALAFIPVGQLCGALLERRNKLSGYGLNL